MSVWISDEKLLIFASLISPSKMILFEKKYQTFDTVFHHQMKHCVSCLIYYLKRDAILAPVAKQWKAKDIPSYGSQSKRAKIAIHWFGKY